MKWFFYKDTKGVDLFYIKVDEFIGDQGIPYLQCHSNFDTLIEMHTDLFQQYTLLSCMRINDPQLPLVIESMFDRIMTIPGIEQFYLPHIFLCKCGQFSYSAYNVLNDIFDSIEYPFDTPISEKSYSTAFYSLKEKIRAAVNRGYAEEVPQIEFELIISNNFHLQSAYVNQYEKISKFYRTDLKIHSDVNPDCFCYIYFTNDVKLFFITLIQ